MQQLLADPGEVALTDLAERLESSSSGSSSGGGGGGNASSSGVGAATAKATMAAAASEVNVTGRSLGATAERRLYDIGSVLSTFSLLNKRLQGGG